MYLDVSGGFDGIGFGSYAAVGGRVSVRVSSVDCDGHGPVEMVKYIDCARSGARSDIEHTPDFRELVMGNCIVCQAHGAEPIEVRA